MTAREQLIQEIEQVSDSLVEEVLDFLLFIKGRQDQKNSISDGEKSQPSEQSILERMGGIPQHLLCVGNLSDRDVRRAVIASRIQQSHQQKS
ncbi:hypothetical protein NIES4072_59400 [Nostoc commune NIES-4072]|uniref:DUF2281 domain-containing protein n=1 Tax=Nostoc commune NIES-4072 TaxID=2005467 RepID=A0A2R5FTZ1_NOSCO|nr:hypothetical protein [Nostoc commune]BBD66784.1 hypothetical protein NIES4070_31530 [Nostoc commune HK-02]GBG22232.1 hypothetical protein NIES4072_59400 [Nostoc commune NIES-4072]